MADDPNTISTNSLAVPISPLRQRMLEDMTIRRPAPRTQAAYLSAVSRFSRHFGPSPDRLSYEDVRAWQLHLVQSGLGASAVNHQITALRFFFCVTLGQRDASQMIPQAREPESLRQVLSADSDCFGRPFQSEFDRGRASFRRDYDCLRFRVWSSGRFGALEAA